VVIYPRANVHLAMRGSDRDDALFDAARALLHGRYPYSRPTYLGNPITPLPGALILAAPFVLLRNVALANVFWSAVLVGTLWWWLRDLRPAVLALLLALLSPEVMHEIATGGDMFANGIYVGAFALLVAVVIPRADVHVLAKVGAVALLGLGLSSRPTYWLVLPALFSYLRVRAGTRLAISWTALSVVVLLVVTAPFYLASPSNFAPFHLTRKLAYTGAFIPDAGLVVPIVVAAISLAVFFRPLSTIRSFLVVAGAMVGLPTYLLAIANLAAAQSRISFEYFAAGLTATGLYILALGGYLALLASKPATSVVAPAARG